MGNLFYEREWARARVEYKFMIIYDATYAIACSKNEKERAWACNSEGCTAWVTYMNKHCCESLSGLLLREVILY